MKWIAFLFAIIIPCSIVKKSWKPPSQIQDALMEVNRIRRAAGLDSVRISEKLSVGCYNHAKYGFPLTIYFAQWQSVKTVKFELSAEDGTLVKCSVSTPEKPATGFSQWNTVCAIPLKLLLPGTTYTMKIKATVDDSDFERETSFKTVESN